MDVAERSPAAWSTATASEIAAAAGATDLFVFRRIERRRFAHVGGVGRGAGWAGIIEVEQDEEPLVRRAFASRSVVRRSGDGPWHVVGPYYQRFVAVVTVSADVFVVFGSPEDTIGALDDEELVALARFASEALVELSPAKRLADELEALNAVRELLHAPPGSFAEAIQHLVETATSALSCDAGLLYIPEGERLAISDRRGREPYDPAQLRAALAVVAARDEFPVCVQEATADELPPPFSAADGVLAYYLLEIEQPLPGILLLLHTAAAVPRGFTLLCQALGARLVETAGPLLASALLRDEMNAELERAAAEARRDPLTGLGNRLAWTEALAEASPTRATPATILLVDCRGLKRVNETHGHHVGDEVLCRVAQALLACVRTGDAVVRLGGDEFAVLLHDADEAIAETIVRRFEGALRGGSTGEGRSLSTAIGVATSRDGDLEAAQRRADAELRRAKRA